MTASASRPQGAFELGIEGGGIYTRRPMANPKAVLTCALTGVLTDPLVHRVPVTPEQMAQEARRARDAGASLVHCHFRAQEEGMGRLPSWDPEVAKAVCDAIRAECPDLMINMSTGVVGPDISEAFADVMKRNAIVPECECFDTGILRSVALFARRGMIPNPPHVSLVMGVESGMPNKAKWLPLLIEEMIPGTHWQVIGIGRQEVWALHRACAELGGDLRTGLEDTFYLPDGSKAASNGPLIEALAKVAREAGREVASPAEARALLGIRKA
jgi:3-keto-5-aminohexanoate cleavage enzyme